MTWDHVKEELTRPHIAYATTGFALILFGTISLFLKEKLYIGEATVATIYGLIVGPHCLNWFSPTTWGNSDYITLEISRIVLIVQIFAVAVELPKKYMLKHWWSVTVLLVPVMTFGWVISSVFIWKLVPTLRWVHALCIAGCITATDPVLASAVVGKGKFAKRVPGHLRNLLSAESGCNDGMAYPFVIMAIYVIQYEHHAAEIAKDFIVIGVLYGCVLGIVIGAVIGYGARVLIKFAEKFNLIDRESFLAYFFCVALFCAGVGTITGTDDLLVAFSAGAAFGWDGWFARQTEESHVSNVIDTLLNTAFFVYFGSIVPWPDFNNHHIGIKAWKLVCLAIIILVVRRIPIIMAMKPVTPDIHTWREALFCGHFGPIGVGAIFMCILARAQLETGTESPTNGLGPEDDPHYYLLATIWPVTCFLVVSSIVVHGSSIAVFTLGKRINNMAITLTYTTGGNEPSWISRLPRRSTEGGNVLQLERMETEKPLGRKLRRRKSSRAKTTNNDAYPQTDTLSLAQNDDHNEAERVARDKNGRPTLPIGLRLTLDLDDEEEPLQITEKVDPMKLQGRTVGEVTAYREGSTVTVENSVGEVIHEFNIGDSHGKIVGDPELEIIEEEPEPEIDPTQGDGRTLDANNPSSYATSASSADTAADSKDPDSRASDDSAGNSPAASASAPPAGTSHQRPRREVPRLMRQRSMVTAPRSGERIYAYQIDDQVVLENEDGDIVRRYKYVPRGGAAVSEPKRKGLARFTHYLPQFVSSRNADRQNHPDDSEKVEDVENAPHGMLVPEEIPPDINRTASEALSHEDERRVQLRLKKMLRSGTLERRVSSGPPHPHDAPGIQLGGMQAPETQRSQVITDDEYATTDYDNDEDEEAEPETAVERHRRLAALGVIPADTGGRDNDNDEDEGEVKNDADEDPEPKITFKLPERRRH